MAWYKTGTVSVTNGSTTVTGSGTNWIAGANVGEGFQGPDGEIYEITAIGSATSLTLAAGYGGSTASGVTYAIVPTHALTASLASSVADLISDYQSVVDNAGAGKFGDGSAAAPAITFTLDQDTGFFRDTANEIAISVAGTKRGEFTASGLDLFGQIRGDTGQFDGNVNIDGTVTADGLTVDGDAEISGTASRLYFTETDVTDKNTRLVSSGGDFFIQTSSDDKGTNTPRFALDHATGDISFYDSAGSSQSLFWDASAERLGIGTSSPKDTLDVVDGISVTDSNTSLTTNTVLNGIDFYTSDPSFLSNTVNRAARIAPISSDVVGQSFDLGFYTASTDADASERMRIDSSGSVGIGTSSPSANLHVNADASAAAILVTSSNTGNADIIFGDQADPSRGDIRYENATDSMRFSTNNKSEAMRIDSSGNLLVGTTSGAVGSNSTNVYGINLFNTGLIASSVNNGASLILNRQNGDGDIAVFRKDGSTVGSIGVQSNALIIDGAQSASDAGIRFAGANWIPRNGGSDIDNGLDLGAASLRFDDLYATNGTIQTSDRNEKQDIEALSDAEQRVAVACKGLLRKFRWKDAVAEKGDDARIHFGIIAQDLQDAFTAEGLDAGDYAMFISSTWWEIQTDVPAVEADEENGIEAKEAYTRTDTYETLEEAPEGAVERTRLGVRYPELLAFIIAAI